MNSIVMQDPNSQLWALTVDGSGILHTEVTTSGPPIVLALQSPSGRSWLLGVDVNGLIQAIVAPFPAEGVARLLLFANDCSGTWYLGINNLGQLTTDPTGIPLSPTVGNLMTQHEGYPTFAQPGGPGTITIPQQQSGGFGNQAVNGVPQELGMGLFTAGCGHWFNSWDVRSANVCGAASAFLCCPLCAYVQRIITPFELIYTDANYLLLA